MILQTKKSGMTIIEVLMAIIIFTLGIAGFTELFVRSWQSNQYFFEMGQSSMAASQGVSRIGEYVRGARQGANGAYPIVSVGNNDLTIYSDFDKDDVTERIHIYKSGTDILMGIAGPTEPTVNKYPLADQEVITLVSQVVNDVNTPVFYYYNNDYPSDQVTNPLTIPVRISSVRLVKIYLQVNTDPNRGPEAVKIESFIEMRNLNDYH